MSDLPSIPRGPHPSSRTWVHTPVRVAVAGVTGYAGAELARLLLRHPRFASTPPLFLGRMLDPGLDTGLGQGFTPDKKTTPEPTPGLGQGFSPDKTSSPEKGLQPRPEPTPGLGEGFSPHTPIRPEATPLTQLHPQLSGLPHADSLDVLPWDWDLLAAERIDLLFLATPHEQARAWAPEALARGLRVIDLSAAWRLQHDDHRAIYKLHDADPAAAQALQRDAVYGSPELHGPAIAHARLVANPGCYATSVILALAPLVRANLLDLSCGIVADAKSGVSGAGKAPTPTTHFMNAADNLSAYAVFGHRHTGELLEQLQLSPDQIQFTPHLLPIPRGILSTIYVRLNQAGSAEKIQACFDEFYAHAPLVRVRRSPMLPQIQHVVRQNFCDLGFALAPDKRRLVLVSCLDNLLKGASSQAVQNLNLMAGWPQTEGLL